MEFVNNFLKRCQFLVRINFLWLCQCLEMLIIQTYSWRISFRQLLKSKNDPLLRVNQLITLRQFSEFAYVSTHYSLNLVVLLSNLVSAFDHIRARKIYSFLNFHEVTFAKIVDGYQNLCNFDVGPIGFGSCSFLLNFIYLFSYIKHHSGYLLLAEPAASTWSISQMRL